jgi:hypothetical protein
MPRGPHGAAGFGRRIRTALRFAKAIDPDIAPLHPGNA